MPEPVTKAEAEDWLRVGRRIIADTMNDMAEAGSDDTIRQGFENSYALVETEVFTTYDIDIDEFEWED